MESIQLIHHLALLGALIAIPATCGLSLAPSILIGCVLYVIFNIIADNADYD